jgi:hypothetical protein
MVNDSDVAMLDDNLIVLFAAAEMLARAKSDDAQGKMSAANELFTKLKGSGIKNDVFVMGGGMPVEGQSFLNGARILPSTRV